MKQPVSFVYGNCVFAASLDDPWAAFRVQTASYAWLSEEGKRARFLAMAGALEAVEADVQLLRVSRRFSSERYAAAVGGECRGGGPWERRTQACARYLREHARRLRELDAAQPLLFMLVSLREPERDVATYVSRAAAEHPRDWWRSARRALALHDRRTFSVRELERTRVSADQVHACMADFLPLRQARGVELQWLMRRAFCRGWANQ